MKRAALASLIALLLLTFAPQNHGAAESDGSSVSGSFQIFTDDGGPTRYIEFFARVDTKGNTTGGTTIRDQTSALDAKADSPDQSLTGSAPAFFAKAEFDCLVIDGNRAVMSGSVTESSSAHYIGRRLLLVVQDGDGFNPPGRDKLTFGIYKQLAKGSLTADSERPDEQGVPVAWIAQDSERPDDEPVIFPKSEVIGCQSFPISSFAFVDVRHGRGDIKFRL